MSARGKRQRGNTIIEFAVATMFLLPLLLGTVNVGMNISRSIQVTQLSRDAGHMYVRFVDFSQPANQDLIVRLATGLGMTRTGGNAKVVLTRVMKIGAEQCAAGGLQLQECTNYQMPVITQQIIIGNPALSPSALGEPPSNLKNDKGEISMSDYLTDVRTRAVGFDAILTLQPGELAYVAEAESVAPEFSFPGFFEQTRVYSRTIY